MSKKEETKKVSKTVEKKSVETKKVSKTTEKKTKEVKKISKPKKEVKAKKESFLSSVKKEMGKVRWPLKKEMVKYSVATLSFIVFFALFFALCDVIIAGIKMLVA